MLFSSFIGVALQCYNAILMCQCVFQVCFGGLLLVELSHILVLNCWMFPHHWMFDIWPGLYGLRDPFLSDDWWVIWFGRSHKGVYCLVSRRVCMLSSSGRKSHPRSQLLSHLCWLLLPHPRPPVFTRSFPWNYHLCSHTQECSPLIAMSECWSLHWSLHNIVATGGAECCIYQFIYSYTIQSLRKNFKDQSMILHWCVVECPLYWILLLIQFIYS